MLATGVVVVLPASSELDIVRILLAVARQLDGTFTPDVSGVWPGRRVWVANEICPLTATDLPAVVTTGRGRRLAAGRRSIPVGALNHGERTPAHRPDR